MNRQLDLLTAVLAALAASSCKRKPPANVAAEVNGHAITFAELEKFYLTQ